MLIHEIPKPCGYGKVNDEWWVRCPGQRHPSRLAPEHVVTEHEDGTITVRPFLSIPDHPVTGAKGWHGWLTKGEFHS